MITNERIINDNFVYAEIKSNENNPSESDILIKQNLERKSEQPSKDDVLVLFLTLF